MNIMEAAASGNRRATLVALRDAIAHTIEYCESGRDMASLSKRLLEVMDEIDLIDAADNPDELDMVFDGL